MLAFPIVTDAVCECPNDETVFEPAAALPDVPVLINKGFCSPIVCVALPPVVVA